MNEPNDEELHRRLTPAQYDVTQKAGTERAFTGEYWDCHDPGMYRCVVCDAPLFTSETKFDSGTGWPSFDRPADQAPVKENMDSSHGMIRTEVVCGNCGAHLGHLFPDGPPQTTGMRYCINSAALRLERDGENSSEA